MEKLFLKDDSLANKISYYHLMLFMVSLPFDRFYSHLILISFAVHTLIQLNRKKMRPVLTISNLLLQSVFFVTLLSTIYTINRPEAFNEWGKQITILLFPILFCLTTLDIKKYRPQLLMVFSLVCTATIAYLYLTAFLTIRYYHLPYSAIISSAFTNHNFSEPIDIHATFFSLQIAIALVYMITVLLKERSNYYRLFYVVCCLILSAGLIQLSSKSIFIALFLVINLAIPYFVLQGKPRLRFILAASAVSVLIIAGIFTFSNLKERYIHDLQYDLALTSKDEALDSRLDRWKTTTELVAQSPVIGYGAGSELGLLHESFFAKKYYSSFLNNLNSHNQYLSFLLKSGIIGLLVYLGALAFGFKQALQRRDLLFFTCMLLVVFVSLSENLLDVDKGIIFYAFFFSFFMFSGDDKRTAV
jgi:O-antigen ligase